MSRANNLVPEMDDEEIRQRVQSLVGSGKSTRILDCEKKSSLITEEVLLLNGKQIKLTGELGERIKEALKGGRAPPPEVLNEILIRAGIETAPVELETTMSVKSTTKTSEMSTLKDSEGKLLDEKLKEFEEDDEFESTNVEMWEKEPEDLRVQLEQERNRMWDFYNNVVQPIVKSNKTTSSMPKKSESIYENIPKFSEFPSPASLPGKSSSFLYENEENVYENVRSVKESTCRTRNNIPGRMPHLTKPLNPDLRPPIPAKPKYYGSLKREKNFQLPVRIVYETFI